MKTPEKKMEHPHVDEPSAAMKYRWWFNMLGLFIPLVIIVVVLAINLVPKWKEELDSQRVAEMAEKAKEAEARASKPAEDVRTPVSVFEPGEPYELKSSNGVLQEEIVLPEGVWSRMIVLPDGVRFHLRMEPNQDFFVKEVFTGTVHSFKEGDQSTKKLGKEKHYYVQATRPNSKLVVSLLPAR